MLVAKFFVDRSRRAPESGTFLLIPYLGSNGAASHVPVQRSCWIQQYMAYILFAEHKPHEAADADSLACMLEIDKCCRLLITKVPVTFW